MSAISFQHSALFSPYLNARVVFTALVCLFAAFACVPSATLAQQRSIINPSFESPVITDLRYVDENSSAGWNTSHPFTIICDVGVSPCRPIEYWRTGHQSFVSATNAGDQFAELNADTNSMIYQSVCLTNNESFDYSFLHRGRGSSSVPDVAQFRIGIPTGLPADSKPADSYSFDILEVSTTNDGTVTTAPTGSGTINNPVAAGNGWVQYSGTYTYTGTTQLANIGFLAVSAGGGNVNAGNFVDDWRINLAPYLEFAAATQSGVETNAAVANPPSIRVGGTIPGGGINVTVQASGGTATIGTDYSLTTAFDPGNTTDTVVVTIPAGEYDGTSSASIFAIPFAIFDDAVSDDGETVNFVITSAPGATIASAVTCGAAPQTTTSYTITEPPTSAIVTVGGRVMSQTGRGIGRVQVMMSSASGEVQTARTNAFGYYHFENVSSGATYVFSLRSKQHSFAPSIMFVNNNLTNVDFTAEPQRLRRTN